ncbi:hypothetical protein RRG08_026286 [Elysia crispata]|uniref:Uncharacterized protein n=1 Tax=Elysia crispata TaxID=231223 RepID=A0AAE0ZBF2_9GAST|nr:hypothetical protein RRG08_026286 [Elysia crispata]
MLRHNMSRANREGLTLSKVARASKNYVFLTVALGGDNEVLKTNQVKELPSLLALRAEETTMLNNEGGAVWG